MFRLNKETTTLDGEVLTPYLVENKFVYCWNSNSKTTVREISDFNMTTELNEQEKIFATPSIKPISPLARKKVEVESITASVSKPSLIPNKEVTTEEQVTEKIIEPIKVEPVFVRVEPAIDDDVTDGVIQTGGVRKATTEEITNETESVFDSYIEDEEYI